MIPDYGIPSLVGEKLLHDSVLYLIPNYSENLENIWIYNQPQYSMYNVLLPQKE